MRNDQAAQKRSAELAAERDSEQAKMRAELDAQLKVQQAKDAEREEIDAATEEAVDAAAEHQSSVQVADSAKEEADRIRRQADTHDQPSRPALSTGEKQENLMKIAEIPFAALRFQYQIARIPFQLIEDQMAARLYKEAPVRLFYERSLGSVDAAVGNLLGDPKLKPTGNSARRAQRCSQPGREARCKRGPPSVSRRTPSWTPPTTRWSPTSRRRATQRSRKPSTPESPPRSVSARQMKAPRSVPPPTKNGPTTSLHNARVPPRRQSAKRKPRFVRRRNEPPTQPRPNSTTLRQNGTRPHASVRKRTGSSNYAGAEKQKRKS